MVLMKRFCCCNSLHYGNLTLGLIAAAIYLSSIVWLTLIYDKFLIANGSRFVVIVIIVILSFHFGNCILLVVGIVVKSTRLIYPWLIGQQVVIVAIIIGPIILMLIGTITYNVLYIVAMVVLTVYQIYHLAGAYSIYTRIKERSGQSEYESF